MNIKKFLYIVVDKIKSKYPEQDLSEFFLRLGSNFDVLYNKFSTLYDAREDFEEKLSELAFSLAEMYIQRSPELRKIDRDREENPEWFMDPKWISTMLYVDRFNKDLKGFVDKIDYLNDLGINYVHLMPLLEMPETENDGGYAVSNYRKIDKKFGSMKDINKIAEIFRKKDMLLELDLVLNHTSDEHEWAQKALKGDKECQEMYYMYDDRSIPDQFEKTLPEVFPETAPGNFTYKSEMNKWVFTVFNNYQWDLNYTNPKVFIEMIKILLNIANQGVDIVRLDAVAFMWKQLGTTCQNLDEAHTILQLYKACSRIVAPGLVFKAEAIVQPLDIVKYLGEGKVDECEIAYNASYMVYLWDAMATQNKNILEIGLENIPRLPAKTTWVNYIRCHDDIGLGYADHDVIAAGYSPFDHRQFIISYYCGEYDFAHGKGQRFMYNPKTKDARISGATASLLGLEKGLEIGNTTIVENAIKKMLLMYSGVMSLGGIPLIYYGDEVAFTNDYSFLNDSLKKNDNRWLNRPVIDWEKVSKKDQSGTIENRVYNSIKQMIDVRREMKEFHSENDYEIVKNENRHVFSFLRELDGEKTLVLMNLSEKPQHLNQYILEKTELGYYVYDQFTGKEIRVEDRMINLNPYEFMWLKKK